MIAVLLSCALIFLVIFWITCFFDGNKVRLPPPAGGALPIVGHAWMGFVKRESLYEIVVQTSLARSLERGEEAVYFCAGTWKVYVCMDPDDGYLLLNSCLKKDPLYSFFDPLFGGAHGLINSDAPIWKIHRKLLNPTFNQRVLDSYLVEFNEQSHQLASLLTQEVSKGYFDPIVYVKQTVLQVVCATILGVSIVGDIDIIEECGKSIEIFTSCMVERIRKFYYHSEFLYNLSTLKKTQDAAVKNVHNLSSNVIRKKKEIISGQEEKGTDNFSATQFKSFLDLLLEMGEDGALTEYEIQQEVHTFILAAFDTTYHALAMTLLTIGSYPEVQQKIVDELITVFEGTTRYVDRQAISKLKYLEAVIKETMRLYPVVVGIGRTLEKDLQIKKYTLPAGSRCFLSIYHVGRHRTWGADASQFRPERWLDGSLPHSMGTYAVFGLGKRSCIGSNYAMMLMKTALCHVVRRYRISGDVTRLVQNIDVVVTPVSGHHISIEQRD